MVSSLSKRILKKPEFFSGGYYRWKELGCLYGSPKPYCRGVVDRSWHPDGFSIQSPTSNPKPSNVRRTGPGLVRSPLVGKNPVPSPY